jgi:hypothetical protein
MIAVADSLCLCLSLCVSVCLVCSCEKWVQWLLTTLPSIGTQGGHRPVVALVGHGEFMYVYGRGNA